MKPSGQKDTIPLNPYLNMTKKRIVLMLLPVLCAGTVWAAKDKTEKSSVSAEEPPAQTEIVDEPTPEIIDPGTYALNFRFYSEGGVTSRILIGPMKRVNLGISFDVQHFTGHDDPHMIRPSVFFKLRFFDGTDKLPALAIGYENQGYIWQKSIDQFLNRERGLYLVASHEIFIPDLEIQAGVNTYDFNNSTVYAFLGTTYKVTNNFSLLAEYDNIRDIAYDRFNMGGRFYVTPKFFVDFCARNIGRDSSKGAERILRLNYAANFPTF